MDRIGKMRALYIIVNDGFTEDVLELARELGARGATIMNARGESAQHESFMGITIDTEKEMILCIVEREIAKKIIYAVKEKAGVDTPAHAVCFTLPVESTVGIIKAHGEDEAGKAGE